MNYKRAKEEFDSLIPKGQYMWALNHKDKITIFLDNDSTFFTFDDENKEKDCSMFSFKTYLGNSGGVDCLLSIVGFKFQGV